MYKFTIRTKRKRNERKTNKCFTRTIRKTHDPNARYTNNWSVHVTIYYPMINDPVSTEVQYSIVLLFEWLLCKLTWLTNLMFMNGVHLSHSRQVAHVYYQLFDSKMADGDQLGGQCRSSNMIYAGMHRQTFEKLTWLKGTYYTENPSIRFMFVTFQYYCICWMSKLPRLKIKHH